MPLVSVEVPGSMINKDKNKEINVEAEQVRDILDYINDNFETDIKEKIITDRKDKNISVWQVSVNGEIKRDLNYKIKPEDEVTIIPLVGGG